MALLVSLCKQVKCLNCRHESERYENIMDLTLEIYGWVESLEDALTQFTTPEDLDGENMYRCGRSVNLLVYAYLGISLFHGCVLTIIFTITSMWKKNKFCTVGASIFCVLYKLYSCHHNFTSILCRCSAYVPARKQLTIHEAPNILTIVLKRFQV